jgi:DNA-binding CsgD family transcriptional regulator
MRTAMHGGIERDIAGLARRGLGSYELRREAMARMDRVLELDGWCFATADPTTLTMTTHCTSGIPRTESAPLYEIEYAGPDVAGHAELARSRRPVRVLADATRGEPERCRRYRMLLQPIGIEHEVRAAVREHGTTWGFMHLFRHQGRRGFDADEAAFVERVTRLLAPALRDALVGPEVHATPAAAAPSLILVDEANRLAEGTPGGRAWMTALRDPELPDGALPDIFLELAIWARALAREGSTDVARARIPGDDGWYAASATCTDRGNVAIIVQPASARELMPLLLRGYRLTAAERQIAELVLDGRSTKQIAAELVVSAHTVQSHLKAVFDKVGVRSRRDLVAQLHA